MYVERFGQRLMQARKDAGLTQQEAARLLETSQSQITKYETQRLEPNIEMLGKLIDLYGINANWLLGTGKYLDE